MGEENGRINVSRDALRAELAQMELRLIDKLATKTEVDVLRKERDDDRQEIESLKRWRAYITGVTGTALALASTCAVYVVYALTH